MRAGLHRHRLVQGANSLSKPDPQWRAMVQAFQKLPCRHGARAKLQAGTERDMQRLSAAGTTHPAGPLRETKAG
eukprot:scaffold3009_cov108-Isochrysis_galbana.AAC.10